VATKVDQVVDVFYVQTIENQKINTKERLEEVKQAILKALPETTHGTDLKSLPNN